MTCLPGILLTVLAVASSSAQDDRTAMERYERAREEKRPDFRTFTSPALAAAVASPAGLWDFLVAPETPYLDRLAASTQGGNVLPFEYLPRLMSARGELGREALVHNWGLRVHPMNSVALPCTSGELSEVAPSRIVLGRPWMVPAQRTEYPLTWREECEAPWPWQVQQALDQLFHALVYRARGESGTAWHEAALAMPRGTDEEALRFVEATGSAIHSVTLPVLSRWRSIALDPTTPEAAARVAFELRELHRIGRDPRSAELAALLALDILRSSPHERARQEAAYSVAGMGKTVLEARREQRPGSESMKPPPFAPIADSLWLELGRKGLDPRAGDEWRRLYVYVFSLCECLESPPIAVNRSMRPNSAEVQRSLDEFARWFRSHEKAFEFGSVREQPRWTELRDLLEASAQR